jgi:hypothetical protein
MQQNNTIGKKWNEMIGGREKINHMSLAWCVMYSVGVIVKIDLNLKLVDLGCGICSRSLLDVKI